MAKKIKKPSTSPSTGSILTSYIKKKRISQASLSRALEIQDSTLVYYLKQQSIQTKTLWELSRILKHNFFMDIAQLQPDTYSVEVNIFESRDKEIAELKHRIEILEAEKAILLEVKKA